MKSLQNRRFTQPKIYRQYLPFPKEYRPSRHIITLAQCLGITILTAFITYTILNNFPPFGITTHYSMNKDSNKISALGPEDRVKVKTENGQKVIYQTQDLTYFTTTMPFSFDQATVRITFKNPNPDQTLSLGFKDEQKWHYDTKLFDVPILNSLPWNKIGQNPVLYQRDATFTNVDDFLANPPRESLIGTYNYDLDIGTTSQSAVPNYTPNQQETILTTPLRGKHVLYTYLENEPFTMQIEKQDLNWYSDPDPVTVTIYKDQDVVFQSTAEDDGIQDDSRKILPAETITIKNPGPELPEKGVYKVVIDANDDTIINRITTNLHKIVFQGPIFPAGNQSAYPIIIPNTLPTTLYTNAFTLSALTYHSAGQQTISVGNQSYPLSMVNTSQIIIPKDDITRVTLPESDAVLNGFMGYFSFDVSQFFLPTAYHILPITKKDDVSLVDYLIADYVPSHKEGAWQVSEQTFDVSKAYIQDGKLSWIIRAPRLEKSNREIMIKDINITFHKKALL